MFCTGWRIRQIADGVERPPLLLLLLQQNVAIAGRARAQPGAPFFWHNIFKCVYVERGVYEPFLFTLSVLCAVLASSRFSGGGGAVRCVFPRPETHARSLATLYYLLRTAHTRRRCSAFIMRVNVNVCAAERRHECGSGERCGVVWCGWLCESTRCAARCA